jgi:hypothetical protein
MASPAESSLSAHGGGPGSQKEEAIDELLERLGFDDDEVDDLIF